MPLIQGKTPKSFKKNVETEMNSGKPQKQALAIAYNVKRRNQKKMAHGGEACMAEGGYVGEEEDELMDSDMNQLHLEPEISDETSGSPSMQAAVKGEDADKEEFPKAYRMSLVDMAMKKRMMANGGMVDDDETDNVDGQPEYEVVDAMDPVDDFEYHPMGDPLDDEEDDQSLIGQVLKKKMARR